MNQKIVAGYTKQWFFTAAPFTSIGSGLIGVFLSTSLLLVMDKQSLLDTNLSLIFFLAGCAYGGYRGRKDIQDGELSLYSKIVSGILIFLLAVGRLLVEKKTLTKTSV